MATGELETAFRAAMRRWPTGVALISARDDSGGRHVMTANSLSSVSMEPPALSVCIDSSAALFAALSQGNPFCVNLLRGDQAVLAELCSDSEASALRFDRGDWRDRALNGSAVPWLRGAQANVFCTRLEQLRVGSHGLFVGAVQAAEVGAEVDPLGYLDGEYRRPGFRAD